MSELQGQRKNSVPTLLSSRGDRQPQRAEDPPPVPLHKGEAKRFSSVPPLPRGVRGDRQPETAIVMAASRFSPPLKEDPPSVPPSQGGRKKVGDLFFVLSLTLCLLPAPGRSQIVPDATLPEDSIVLPNGDTFTIQGGTAAGRNLFHSFEEFSLPTGNIASFESLPAIDNIITRVTGELASDIDGTIAADANLYFLNPNGIVFGPNAQLEIDGSFLATTAERFQFADGLEFGTEGAGTGALPLLSVEVPVGIQYGSVAEPITVNGSLLEVPPTETLALLGGEITLTAFEDFTSELRAEGGRVELGSVGANSRVGLDGSNFNYDSVTSFQDLNLSNSTFIDTSGEGGGPVQLAGRNVMLTEGSLVQSTTFGAQPGGDITVIASELLELSGNTPDRFPSGLLAETAGIGDGGNIDITARQLTFRNGGQASASALFESEGRGGDITVTVAESIELIGEAPSPLDENGIPFTILSGFVSDAQAEGSGGSITLMSESLTIHNGAQISTSTFGDSDGGKISIDAFDFIELSGISDNQGFPSGIFSATLEGEGDGGEINVNAQQLRIFDGAQIATSTFNAGNAGDISLNTSVSVNISGQFELRSGLFSEAFPGANGEAGNIIVVTDTMSVSDGARVLTSTGGAAQGGDLDVTVNRLFLNNGGQLFSGTTSSGSSGNLTINAFERFESIGSVVEETDTGILQRFPSGAFTQTQNAGNAGDLSINTPFLLVADGAEIAVSSEVPEGTPPEILGNAGILSINATDIRVNNEGILNAETFSGEGGNIDINSGDIRLRNGFISATAGLANVPDSGRGGNITIDTDTLVGLRNSDISANAFDDEGGRINITADAILGLEPLTRIELAEIGAPETFDPMIQPDSLITAFSRTNPELSGTIAIRTPDTDPTQGLTQLEDAFAAIPIDRTVCRLAGEESEFIQTGRSGLPPSYTDPFSGGQILEDIRPIPLDETGDNRSHSPVELESGDRIIEASHWHINTDGHLQLVPASTTPRNPFQLEDGCRVETKSQAEESSDDRFPVANLELAGNTVLNANEVNSILSEYSQRSLSFSELEEVRDRITNLYIQNGYITSGAYLPPQTSTDGNLTLAVSEGTYADVEVRTEGRLNPNYVRSRLGVAPGEILNQNQLLKNLQLLQLDDRIRTISAELARGVVPGTSFLTVSVRELPLLTAGLSLDNNRSPSVGTFRQIARAYINNPSGLGDIASISYTNTEGSGDWGLGYAIPLNPDGGVLSFSYSNGENQVIESPFRSLDLQANSQVYELTFRQPLMREAVLPTPENRDRNIFRELAIGFTASRRESQTSILGIDFPLSPGAEDDGETNISTLRFFQDWTQQGQNHVFAARSEFNFGVDWLNATTSDDAPDSQFFAWRGRAQWVRRLQEQSRALLVVRGDVQLTPDALVPFEQISLGGRSSARGYRQDRLLADNGMLASVELRLPLLEFPRWQGELDIVPFVDAGWVWNGDSDDRDDLEKNILVSTGIGLRLRLGDRWRARFDWGLPLVDLDDRGDSWQEEGFYFSVESDLF